MRKRRLFVTLALVGLLVICSIVDRFTGFEKGYFAIGTAIALAGYWIVEFLIDLIYFSYCYDEDYKIFIAEKVNKTVLTYEDIKAKNEYYFKEFKRSRRKEKFYYYLNLFLTMGVFIFLIVCLF